MEKHLAQIALWQEGHSEEIGALKKMWEGSQSRKGGKFYIDTQRYKRMGIQGSKNKVRKHHSDMWRKYKNIIAPGSQIHHEWIPGTSDYRGVALVDADQHMLGIIKVIEVLGGEITMFKEENLYKNEVI